MARRIATIAAAVVLALLGTVLVVVYVGRADARAMKGMETVDVLVAAGPLAQGQTVAEVQAAGLVGTQTLPRKAVPDQALTTFLPSDTSLVFANDVTPGEIIQRPRLVAATEVRPDRIKVPDGKLAVTLELADPARVGSFVKPGSEIAVFDSFTAAPGGPAEDSAPSGEGLTTGPDARQTTRVLLPRVPVLAVGRDAAAVVPPADGESGAAAAEPETSTLVTVAVDQDQALKLVHAVHTGTLYLGLLGSYEVTPGEGVDNQSLFDQ